MKAEVHRFFLVIHAKDSCGNEEILLSAAGQLCKPHVVIILAEGRGPFIQCQAILQRLRFFFRRRVLLLDTKGSRQSTLLGLCNSLGVKFRKGDFFTFILNREIIYPNYFQDALEMLASGSFAATDIGFFKWNFVRSVNSRNISNFAREGSRFPWVKFEREAVATESGYHQDGIPIAARLFPAHLLRDLSFSGFGEIPKNLRRVCDKQPEVKFRPLRRVALEIDLADCTMAEKKFSKATALSEKLVVMAEKCPPLSPIVKFLFSFFIRHGQMKNMIKSIVRRKT
jgi:hypothetical protein